MNRASLLYLSLFLPAIFVSNVLAGDFDWLKNLEVEAQADSSGFHYSLSTRFNVGGAQVNAVLSNVAKPSDAYMVFRLGEISHRPVEQVMRVYRTKRKRGWGVIAKNLGIKPGSREFHALKRGHDLHAGKRSRGKSKHKSHPSHRGKGRNGK